MQYRLLSSTVAILFSVLCLTLILLPEIVYWLFSLEGNALGDFLAKRAGVLFLGLALLCLLSRNTTSTEVIKLVSLSIGTAMAAMAFLGLYEFVLGAAGMGILIAVAIEIAIAILFLGQVAGRQKMP